MKKIVGLALVLMTAMAALSATHENYRSLEELDKIDRSAAIPISEKTARINSPEYKILCDTGYDLKYADKLIPYIENVLRIDVLSAYAELDVFLIPEDPSSIEKFTIDSGYSFIPLREGTISFKIYLYDSRSETLYETEADFCCSLPQESNFNISIYSGSPEFGKVFTRTDVYAKFINLPVRGILAYTVSDENNNIIAYTPSWWTIYDSIILFADDNNTPGRYTFTGITYDQRQEDLCYVKKDFEILE